MLAPKKLKFRKTQKVRIKGNSKRGTALAFGDYGLMATEMGYITARQIEAARIAMTRHIKRGGRVWIKVFPHKPVTKKPAEVRMGKGKGAVDHYVAPIAPGRILYEMGDVSPDIAAQALQLAASKLPFKTKLLMSNDDAWETGKANTQSEKKQA